MHESARKEIREALSLTSDDLDISIHHFKNMQHLMMSGKQWDNLDIVKYVQTIPVPESARLFVMCKFMQWVGDNCNVIEVR